MPNRQQPERMTAPSVFPFSGICAWCNRDRDDLFHHTDDNALYCTDVFRCEQRHHIQAERVARQKAAKQDA